MPDLGYYIARFRELPPGTALKKAVMRPLKVATVKLEGVAAKLSPQHISDEELLQSLEKFTSIEDALHALRSERPPFFVQTSAKEQLVSLIRRQFPHLAAEIVEEAEKVCRHVFDLLGSGPVNLDEFAERRGGREVCGYLPWHFDFKTGYRWNPKKFYKEIRPAYGKADIKVPWELSRFQHAAVLGQAYWLTGDERYAREFVRQVDNWIDRNPPKFGVNWACTMDVAIRVCNWLVAWQLFQGADAITDTFTYKFYRSLLEHGRFIRANLEYSETLTSNHYLSDIVGLLYLGILAPQFKEAEKWRDFARRELVREMEKQVYPDGFDFEASTCYHRLVLELFLYSALLCRRNGIELPQAFWDRLYKMFEVVLYILKPNGRLPQLGDNDSGRLHILYPREVLDGTYLLSYAAIFFEDSNFKLPQFDLAPEAVWVFGREGVEKWQALPPRSEPPGSKAFPDAGVYVMRHNDDYMLISCGPNGQNGFGGHAHNDKLSFELCIGGEEVIVDPGTYVYTPYPEWRNRFRATAYHNTVVVDGQEQNPIEENELFRLPDLTRCRCLVWETGPEKDVFVGEHYGYLRLDPPVVHRRTVEFHKKERTWVITDYLYQPMDLGIAGAGGRRASGGRGWWLARPGHPRCDLPPYRGSYGVRQAPKAARGDHLLELNLHLGPGVEVLLGDVMAGQRAVPGADPPPPLWREPVALANRRPAPGPALSAGSGCRGPDTTTDQPAPPSFRLARAGRVLAEVQAWGWLRPQNTSGWYSPEYGGREEAMVVKLVVQAACPVECRLVVVAL